MGNVLDDLFQWASQQPSVNSTTVRLALASNELTRQNLVSYAEGPLIYRPFAFTGWAFIEPSFASTPNGITQYFSDRRSAIGGAITNSPFDPNNTDPLDVTISQGLIGVNYGITVHSSKWKFRFNFSPTFDAATGVILGSNGPTLITMTLCDRSSIPPIK